MAKNKKSFIAYSDWNGMFKALPDEVAGKLIKHIFSYVNDENPSTDDYVINALFEQVKATLKRDLEKWEAQTDQRKKAGKRSAEVRKQNATVVNGRSISSTDSVSDSVSVNENKDKKKIPPFEDFKVYALENQPNTDLHSLELKYKAWVENGWRDGNNKPIKNWKSKLLNTLKFIQSNEKPKDNITKSDEPDDGGWKIHRSKNG